MAEEQQHRDKTCHECKCRDCNPITAMAERVDAWKSAESLIFSREWGAGNDADVDVVLTPQDVHILANWLLYGPMGDDEN